MTTASFRRNEILRCRKARIKKRKK